MRILQVSHRFLPSTGGTEQSVARLSQGLAAAGNHVTVLTSSEPGVPMSETLEGVEIVRLPLVYVGPFRVPRGYGKALRRIPWDILHIHGQRVWSSDAILPFLGRYPGAKVFTPHGFYQWHLHHSLKEILYYRLWFAKRVRHFSCIVALTEGERSTLIDWGVPSEQISLIPPGVDLREFEEVAESSRPFIDSSGRPVVLYVGGFYPNKRVDHLIRGLASAVAECKLLVVGAEGKTLWGADYCRRLAHGLGVDVEFRGVIPRRELITLYQSSTLLALPSLFEGFGLVLLEALAAGLPFVSTPVGGAHELARSGGGVVAPMTNIGEAIADLLADRGRREAMAERGPEIAQQYSWERTTSAHLEVYERLQALGSNP